MQDDLHTVASNDNGYCGNCDESDSEHNDIGVLLLARTVHSRKHVTSSSHGFTWQEGELESLSIINSACQPEFKLLKIAVLLSLPHRTEAWIASESSLNRFESTVIRDPPHKASPVRKRLEARNSPK